MRRCRVSAVFTFLDRQHMPKLVLAILIGMTTNRYERLVAGAAERRRDVRRNAPAGGGLATKLDRGPKPHAGMASATRHGSDDHERLGAQRHRGRQRGVRWFMRQVLFAGENRTN